MDGDDATPEDADEADGKPKPSGIEATLEAVETAGDAASAGCCLAEAAASVGLIDCFVATAVLGSPGHPDLDSLRRLRDEVLANHRAGRLFIRLYYRWGRYAATAIRGRPVPCFLVREGLVRPAARLARAILGGN